MHPDMIREFIAEFQREVQAQRLATLSARAGAEQDLSKVTKEIDNIITAITQGMFHPSMKARMDGLEADKARLAAQLADLPEPEPITLHPGLADTYARTIADLVTALNADDTRDEAADILRGLIEKIVLTPDPTAPNGHSIELFGQLGAILTLCGNGNSTNAKARRGTAGFRQVTMVAGAGCVEAPTINIAAQSSSTLQETGTD
jgi:site-specific DNA recombinase